MFVIVILPASPIGIRKERDQALRNACRLKRWELAHALDEEANGSSTAISSMRAARIRIVIYAAS